MRMIAVPVVAALLSSCAITLQPSSTAPDIGALTRAADQASAEGDLKACISRFTDAIATSPTLVRAYIGRADCYTRSGNPAAAVQDYSKAIDLSPDDPQLYLRRAAAELAVGNNSAASSDYRRMSSLASANQHDLAQAAEGLVGVGSFLEAQAVVDDGLKHYGSSWELHRFRAIVERDLGNDGEALREFAAAARMASGANLAQVDADQGDFYLLRQQYLLAIRAYSDAIRLDSTQYRYLAERGRAQSAAGDFTNAQVDYTAAIVLYRSRSITDQDVIAELFIERGRGYQQQGSPQQALADFREAFQVSRPSNTPLRSDIQRLIASVASP
jgi:tetratricopeptide (TPR) repeat protein